MKKIVSFVIFICMMISGFSAFAEKPTYNDIENHWAKDVIEDWSSYEIINGYEGNFSPDKNITRGEFATIINRIFKFDVPSQNTFEDLDDNYYTGHILCLNNRGIMSGFENKIRPGDCITREEAATIICKALELEKQNALKRKFSDEAEISDWAEPYVATLVNNGYLNGNDGYLRPDDNITRAEAITLLQNCITIVNNSADKSEFEKICIVNMNNLILKDCVFKNDVFVTGDAENVSFKNSSIDGTLRALGSSQHSISLKNCALKAVEAIHPTVIYEDMSEEEHEAIDIKKEETNEIADFQEEAEEDILDDEAAGEGYFDSYYEDTENKNEEKEDTVIPEDENIIIETTLEDGVFQRNSKKVFDVFAKDAEGNKINCKVRCNDINIEPSWDDETKTSFTLEFQDSGEYVVEITATDAEGRTQTKTYSITYEMAEYGEVIGKATVCIEAFTVGGGYIVAPIEIDVLEGVNCAYLLDEFLNDNNLSYMSTGSLDGGFYLATISDIPEFTPVICETLLSALTDAGFDVQSESYTPNELSEFDFTQGSGWMYCVNGIFPNVGFSEYYLQDGDVMRIQFTLAYGSDIGGASGAGYSYAGDFYEMVNRDELTKIIADIGIENCQEYMKLISKPDLTEDELTDLLNKLR